MTSDSTDTDATAPDPREPREPRTGSDAEHEPPTAEHDAPTPEREAPPGTGPGVPAPPPVRQLLRYPDAGPVAGLAAGVGAYFGVDPVLVRIAFVLLAFAGGSGILLYLVGWALVPEAPAGSVPQGPPAGGARAGQHGQPAQAGARPDSAVQWVGIGLIVLAALWLTARFDFVSPPVLWAVALVVVGVLLFRGDLSGSASPGPRQEPPGPPAEAARAPVAASRAGAAPPAAWQPPAQPPPAPPPQEPPSRLGRLTLGAGLLAGGAAALLDSAGVLDLSFRHYVALALVVVGLGLVVGAWWGRARWLVAVGLLLAPVVLLASVASAFVNVRGGAGERFYAPGELAEVRDSYELFAGTMQIDLSGVDLAGEHVDVAGSVTFGELVVVVPPDASVEVDAVVGGGEIQLPAEAQGGGFAPGRPVSGMRVERRATLEGEPGAGSLALDLRTAFGTVVVRRGP